MKLQKLDTLQKNFLNSTSLFLISLPSLEDRKVILEEGAETLQRQLPSSQMLRTSSVIEALTFLQAPRLFEKTLIVWTPEVKKEGIKELKAYLKNPAPDSFLLLGFEDEKTAADFYHEKAIWLDLSKETAQAKQTRIQQTVVSFAHKLGKQIHPAALNALLEQIPDSSLLRQEVRKLVTFIGERPEIQKTDVEAISTKMETDRASFSFVESLLWGKPELPLSIEDVSALLSLIGQLRYVIEMSLAISCLENREAVQHLYPNLRPYVIDKYWREAPRKGPDYFKKALKALFEMEFKAKRSLGNPQLLFDQFCGEIQC